MVPSWLIRKRGWHWAVWLALAVGQCMLLLGSCRCASMSVEGNGPGGGLLRCLRSKCLTDVWPRASIQVMVSCASGGRASAAATIYQAHEAKWTPEQVRISVHDNDRGSRLACTPL
jgi:hypothetical protein